MPVICRWQRRIRRNSNSANLHRSEISGNKLSVIGQEQHDAVAGLDSKLKKGVADAIDFFGNLTVSPGLVIGNDRGSVPASLPQMPIDKMIRDVVDIRCVDERNRGHYYI